MAELTTARNNRVRAFAPMMRALWGALALPGAPQFRMGRSADDG